MSDYDKHNIEKCIELRRALNEALAKVRDRYEITNPHEDDPDEQIRDHHEIRDILVFEDEVEILDDEGTTYTLEEWLALPVSS